MSSLSPPNLQSKFDPEVPLSNATNRSIVGTEGPYLKTISYRYINITILFMLPESSIIFGAGKNIHTYNAKEIVGEVVTNLRGYKKIFFVRTIKGK